MPIRWLLVIAVALLFAVGFLFHTPVHWRASYANVSVDTMADCLAAANARDYTVVPHQRTYLQLTRLSLYKPGTNNFEGEYEIQQAGTDIVVTWRDVEGRPLSDHEVDREARDRADGCRKGL